MNMRDQDGYEGQRSFSDDVWNMVTQRARHCDGTFVYAAITTGIYCRPSCPARHPHRRNTLLFPTAEDAENKGFIACSRCCPGSNSLTLAEKCIEAVLKYIEAHFNQRITLKTLSQITGLSPNHLQHTFNRTVGLSPKAFCDARRLAHLKQFLILGESISSACYGAGYGSSRALYEKGKHSFAMTPATYQRGGDGIRIHYAIADSALGRVLIAGTESGVCTVLMGENANSLVTELRQEFPKAVLIREKASPRSWNAAVQSCQAEDPLLLKLPLTLRRQIFQARFYDAFR